MEPLMPDLSVKGVPEAEVERLRERAKRNHRSLQGELRKIIEDAAGRAPVTLDELAAMGRRLGLSTPSQSARMIREDRDR